MKYIEIYTKVADELNLPIEVVIEAYKSYWKFIRKTIQELPLKENLSNDEFLKLKRNFNLPSLGKLVCTEDKYKKLKRQNIFCKERRTNKKEE